MSSSPPQKTITALSKECGTLFNTINEKLDRSNAAYTAFSTSLKRFETWCSTHDATGSLNHRLRRHEYLKEGLFKLLTELEAKLTRGTLV